MELTTELNVNGHLAIQWNSEVYLMQVINVYFHKTKWLSKKSYTLPNRVLGPRFQAWGACISYKNHVKNTWGSGEWDYDGMLTETGVQLPAQILFEAGFLFVVFVLAFVLPWSLRSFWGALENSAGKWILLLILDYAYSAFELSCRSSGYEVAREVQLAFLGKLEFPAFHEGCRIRIKGGKDYYFLLYSEKNSVFSPKIWKMFCSWPEEKF